MATRKRTKASMAANRKPASGSWCPPWLKSALERLEDMQATVSRRLNELEAARGPMATVFPTPPSEFDRAAVYRGHTAPAPVPPLEIGQVSANVRPDAKKRRLLDETSEWFPPPAMPRRSCGIYPETIKVTDAALNGELHPHESSAHEHPVLLVLSEVVNLRKRIDAQERLLRFLVERAPGA